MPSSITTLPINIPKCVNGLPDTPAGPSTSLRPPHLGSMRSRLSSPSSTRRRLIRGVFRSVDDLQAAINRFVLETNAEPKPFIWTADPNRVLAAVKRGKQGLESIH